MRYKKALLTGLVVLSVILTGCAGVETNTESPTTNEELSSTESPTTNEELSSHQTTMSTTDKSEPEKGDQFVSLTQVNSSIVKKVNNSKKSDFNDLEEDQKRVFLEAYNCSCNVEQTTFSFYNKSRIEYVKYKNQWYFVLVMIV